MTRSTRRPTCETIADRVMAAVSVIIPTYNRAVFLAGAIESARQAGSDLEIIVVDDASTDDTREVCQKLSGIRYIRLPRNRGLAAARNAGVLASSAEFVAFLDDDDLRLPNTIDLQIRSLEVDPKAVLVYGRVLSEDARRRLPTGHIVPEDCPRGDVFWKLLTGNFIPVLSVLARRRQLFEGGGFRTDLRVLEDWDLWLRLSERFPFRTVEEVVAMYRVSNSSSSQMSSDRVFMIQEMMRMQETAMQCGRARAASWSQRRKCRRELRRSTYNSLVYDAASALAEDDRLRAGNYLRFALRLCPFRLAAFWWLIRFAFTRQHFATVESRTVEKVQTH